MFPTLNRIHIGVKKTNSRSSNLDSENYKCLKTCRTIDGHREGKSQARKSYSRERFLLLHPSSSYHLEYMMATNNTLFEKDKVFGFCINARHLKQVIAECVISTFKHRQLPSSMHILHIACSTSCWAWL